MQVGIKAIEYELPANKLTNEDLENIYGDWSAEKIFKKTGIKERHCFRKKSVLQI